MLLEQTHVSLAHALCARYGAASEALREDAAARELFTSRLTNAQILGTIELLETYRDHCSYNVGVGSLLGGLAVDMEEFL